MLFDTRELEPIAPRLHRVLFHFLEMADAEARDLEGYSEITCALERVARSLGMSRRAVVNHVRELERTKFVRRSTSPGRMNTYKVWMGIKHA